MPEEALKMSHICKVYPNGVMANKDVTLSVRKGEIHALSGENGAGKSTLMKILFGEEQATSGEISVAGETVHISSPHMAIKLGIGMVHQHFMLVPSFTVTENIILGSEPKKGIKIDDGTANKKVEELGRKFNLYVDPRKKAQELSVGQKQKLEILKVLYHGAQILILDEPTAVLTPQETEELFTELLKLKENGYTIIFISHKLHEIKKICDRITIIRHGVTMGVYDVSKVSEQEISRLMVGRDVVLDIRKDAYHPNKPLVVIKHLCAVNNSDKQTLHDISFTLHEGEILGIAGVEGNGQTELVQALTGMTANYSGNIEICGKNIKGYSVKQIRELKLAHIPEDRMTMGIVPGLSIIENMIADKLDTKLFYYHGFVKKGALAEYGRKMVEDFNIVCKSEDVSVNSLSGGNIQKVVLARELSNEPKVIVADQPTRGVDVGASEFIRKKLISMRDGGDGVILVTSDLNEVLGLSDNLIILFEGKISAYIEDVKNVTEEELGEYMLGIKHQSETQIMEAVHGQ